MTAPQHARAVPAPRRAPVEARPRLRVVQPGEIDVRARRHRTRLMTIVTLIVVAGGLFGLVASHVVLTQNQFRLQRLQVSADKAESRYERLRLEKARLEAPERIVAVAQQRLGMVPPATVRYLTPIASIATAGTPANAGSSRVAVAAPTADWSSVKQRLAQRP